MTAASFINLDLELSADTPLDALAEHFMASSFVLFCGEAQGAYRLAVEPVIEGGLCADLMKCTTHFLAIIQTLPDGLSALWQACSSRVFDYGFEGGLAYPPLQVTLPTAALAAMARHGIDLRTTIYPFQPTADDAPPA